MTSNNSRRRFLGTAATAAMTLAGTQLNIPALAHTTSTGTTSSSQNSFLPEQFAPVSNPYLPST